MNASCSYDECHTHTLKERPLNWVKPRKKNRRATWDVLDSTQNGRNFQMPFFFRTFLFCFSEGLSESCSTLRSWQKLSIRLCVYIVPRILADIRADDIWIPKQSWSSFFFKEKKNKNTDNTTDESRLQSSNTICCLILIVIQGYKLVDKSISINRQSSVSPFCDVMSTNERIADTRKPSQPP